MNILIGVSMKGGPSLLPKDPKQKAIVSIVFAPPGASRIGI